MCAHIGQNRHIYPPSIYGVHFDSYPLPPFAQVDGGGCYREKFFLILFFWLRFRILFFQNIASTRQVFTRYSLSAFIFSRFILVWLRFGVYFISLRIMASIWFSITILTSLLIYDSFLLASSYVDSMLYFFNSLSLWLFCLL